MQAFEWLVRDVSRLKTFVESSLDDASGDPAAADPEIDIPSQNSFEVLRDSPILGDGKFKLEIGISLLLGDRAYF